MNDLSITQAALIEIQATQIVSLFDAIALLKEDLGALCKDDFDDFDEVHSFTEEALVLHIKFMEKSNG